MSALSRNVWDTVSSPGVVFSAGTTTNNLTAVTFSNSNGVSFGLNNGVITASAVGGTGGAGSLSISDNVTSLAVSQLAFTNSNGITMTLSTVPGAATLIASYTVPSVTNSSWTVSDAVTSATVGRLAFTNSNGLTLSLSTSNNGNHTVIGSYTVPTVTNSAWTVSDSATSATVARLMFSNANGVSFGLITSNNGSQSVTASIATTYAGTGFTSTTTAGTAIVGTLNTSGLSLGVPAFLTTAAQTSQTLAFTLGGNSGTTNSSQILNGGYILAGGANITINQSNNSISIVGAAAGTGGGIVGLSNSQTLFSSGTVAFSEGGGAITIASSAGGQSFMFSVPQTSSLVGTNGISISTTDSTISVSFLGVTLSDSATSATIGRLAFVNSNGVSFGLSTSNNGQQTVTASVNNSTISYWANIDEFQGTQTTMAQSNSFYVFPITIPRPVSASYLRLLGSINFTSTTIATSAVNNATGASTAFSETVQFNAVLYSVGAGASSRSLQYVYSNSAGITWAASVSQASTSNASNQSITQGITYPNEGANTANLTTQYSVSTSNGPISTTQFSNLSAQRFVDIPFATLITPGNYWLALNRISGTVGGKNMDVNATVYGNSQQNLTFGNIGVATNLSNAAPQIGIGLWTTNAAQTTSSIAFASVSATTSYMIPFVQLIRQA